jgi:DNA-binding transcriptional LysR family regulator
LLAHSEQIELVSAAVQSVSEFNREISGSITLGTGATAVSIFSPLLLNCVSNHPLPMSACRNTLDIVRAVEENRLDLGGNAPAIGRNLAVTPVIDEEFVCILASNQEALPPAVTPEVLQTLPLIAFESGSGTRDLIDGWFLADGRAIAPVMQLGSIEAIKRMVRAG